MSADLVLTNGAIYTVDPQRSGATAVAIRDGKILAVGQDEEIKPLLKTGGEWIDLQGRGVTPGLIDAHVHFQWYSLGLRQVDLQEVPSVGMALQRVEERLGQLKSSEWLQGRGWTQELWTERQFPNKEMLDRVTGDVPAFLIHKSGHAAWVNSVALHRAGITSTTPDPVGGQIQRNEKGQPSGILFEEAMELISRHIPPPTPETVADAMRQAQQNCWQAGLVGLHDFDGRTSFQALQLLRGNGQLGLRVVKNIQAQYLDHAVGVGLRTGFGDDWLRIGGIKIFADGALGPRTALMVEPYEGEPTNRGIAVKDKEEMMAIASRASLNGFSLTIHAIGDRANHDVLDIFTALRVEEATRHFGKDTAVYLSPKQFALRHRIEHVQLFHPMDHPRLAHLGVIASMQPIHATSDMVMADRYWGERAKYSYAWRTVLNSGAMLVFGSDCPIEPIEPLKGIYAAVTRRRPNGEYAPHGWYSEQKLTMQEAIQAFTWAAAYTSGQEQKTGSIVPGKLADLTIFDRDLLAVSVEELPEVQIAGTLINGQFRHRTF